MRVTFKTDLFESAKDGNPAQINGYDTEYKFFRIPAITVLDQRRVAFAFEARKGARDWGDIDLVVGTYDLFTSQHTYDIFEAHMLAEEAGVAPIEQHPIALERKLTKPGRLGLNNPTLIWDGVELHLLFCAEYHRVFHRRFVGGRWQKPREITESFKTCLVDYWNKPWRVIATGPGHGILTESDSLVVPVWYSTGEGKLAHHPSHVGAVRSDDDGETWCATELVDEVSSVSYPPICDPSETAIIEYPTDKDDPGPTLVMFMRHEGEHAKKAITISYDGGLNWGQVSYLEDVPETICMAGAGYDPKRHVTYLASPAGGGSHGVKTRANLTLWELHGLGAVNRKLLVEEGPCGYADVGVLPSGDVVLFYCRGAVDGNPFKPESLRLALVRT
jgi:sialidase-1